MGVTSGAACRDVRWTVRANNRHERRRATYCTRISECEPSRTFTKLRDSGLSQPPYDAPVSTRGAQIGYVGLRLIPVRQCCVGIFAHTALAFFGENLRTSILIHSGPSDFCGIETFPSRHVCSMPPMCGRRCFVLKRIFSIPNGKRHWEGIPRRENRCDRKGRTVYIRTTTTTVGPVSYAVDGTSFLCPAIYHFRQFVSAAASCVSAAASCVSAAVYGSGSTYEDRT